jgi:hypothetical protein
MASNIRVDVNQSAIRDLLRSREVERDLLARAQRIARAAGEGYEADSQIGTNRARASVRTVGPAAAMDEAIDHTLLRALDAGRG